jgi:hypothetical protein
MFYTNVPLRVLRLLTIEVMLQERICGGGIRGRECLSAGEPGRGLVYRGLKCRRRHWRRVPLSIGAPLGRMGEVRSPETLINSWSALETDNLSLWALCEGTLEGADLLVTLKVC